MTEDELATITRTVNTVLTEHSARVEADIHRCLSCVEQFLRLVRVERERADDAERRLAMVPRPMHPSPMPPSEGERECARIRGTEETEDLDGAVPLGTGDVGSK